MAMSLLAVVLLLAPQGSAPPESPSAQRLDDEQAKKLALAALDQAARFDKLPRFSCQSKYRSGVVDSMRAVDATIEKLRQAWTDPVLAKDWVGWYEKGFSWDENRFLSETRPGETRLPYESHFWTKSDAWARYEANDHTSISFVRAAGPAKFWKSVLLFNFSYLRLTPHRYWWGQTVEVNHHTMSCVPPERVTWKSLGAEEFGGELCDVVDSLQRGQRLWIARDIGRVRGALTYWVTVDGASSMTFFQSEPVQRIAGKKFERHLDYHNWRQREATEEQLIDVSLAWAELLPNTAPENMRPNELVLLDDYREISPGVWLPFKEVRAFPHASDTVRGKRKLIRSELIVQEIKTDLDLAERWAELLPKEGDRVQDQRFAVAVNLQHRANRSDDEIRKMAAAQYDKMLEGEAILKQLTQPIADMVGKPALALPAIGWIGGAPPDLVGKPYLIHFWATWCGPCKTDLPRLKALREQGVIVIGMHPPSTEEEEVAKAVKDHQLDYPTFLSPTKNDSPQQAKIAGYPAGVYPYCILVNAEGEIAAHGTLSQLLESVGPAAMTAPRKDAAK